MRPGAVCDLFAARLLVGIGRLPSPAAVSLISDSFPAVGGAPRSASSSPDGRRRSYRDRSGGILLGAAQGGAFLAWPLLGQLEPWRVVLVLVGSSDSRFPSAA